jgi:tetratricopeptide (TPR) repeat protein
MWTAAGMAVVRSPEFQRRFPEALRDPWRRHSKGNSLYRNMGNGRFEDIGAARGVEMGRWAWSCDAADFDNDGQPEIFITCGMLSGPKQPDLMSFFWRQVVAKSPPDSTRSTAYEAGWNAINQFMREGYSWNGNEPNVFYRREGERYRDRSAESGLGFSGDSRAFAWTDFDGDGCLDVLVKNRLAPQVRVFQNRCGQGRERIGLRLVGVTSNRDGIGARVALGKQVKWLAAGSGYLSQHTKTLYFGLPAGMEPVEITWPSGIRQRVEGLNPNALYEVTEGKGARLVRRFATAPALAPKPGKADNEPRLHDTWLQDPVPLPEKSAAGLLVLDERLLSRPEMFAAYSIFRRYLFEFRAGLELPFAMLLNREGQAVKIYARVPSSAQVDADAKAAGRQTALAYPGRWLSQPRRDYFKLGAALLWSGYGEQALPYLELVLRQQPHNARTMVLAAQIHREAGRHREAIALLDNALKIDPSLSEAWNEMGGVALAENRLDEALGHFQQALTGKPDLLYALLNAAQTAAQLRRTEAAEGYYRKAVAAHPASADAANGLGLLLARSGRRGEAEQQLKLATRLDPALASAWNNLAVLYLNQKRTGDAVAALEEGMRHSPADETLYLNLGRYYVQAGDREKARDTMRRLLKAKPDSAVARKALEDLR